jgi:hypothetical protein
MTCCLRWKTVESPSRGKLPNLLVKINSKLGGINHSISLANHSVALFEQLCMMVGIDVSHPIPGGGVSIAAVVGSLDRQVCSLTLLTSSSFDLLAFRQLNMQLTSQHKRQGSRSLPLLKRP